MRLVLVALGLLLSSLSAQAQTSSPKALTGDDPFAAENCLQISLSMQVFLSQVLAVPPAPNSPPDFQDQNKLAQRIAQQNARFWTVDLVNNKGRDYASSTVAQIKQSKPIITAATADQANVARAFELLSYCDRLQAQKVKGAQ